MDISLEKMNVRVSHIFYILSICSVFLVKNSEPAEKLCEVDVAFHLYTKQNVYFPQLLELDSEIFVRKSNFLSSKSTIFFIHGWRNKGRFKSVTEIIRQSYLKTSTYTNVIVVNWKPSNASRYHRPVNMIVNVGTQVARMIDFLNNFAGLRLSSTTLVGHSLGAHIMGAAGHRVTVGKVNQIFALDPLRLSLKNLDSKLRLSRKSARNVQGIHTNGNQQGLLQPLGHADFYPNGGSSQPGCHSMDVYTNGLCSHDRALWIFAESIKSPVGFRALRCRPGENPYQGQCTGKVAFMGGRSNDINVTGQYYLKTHSDWPFALKLRRENGTYTFVRI